MLRNGKISLPHVGVVQWTGRQPRLNKSEDLFVGCSIRNRHFTRDFFKKTFKLAKEHFRCVYVVIFDIPYAYNDAAERGESKPNEKDFKKNIKIGNEREKSIRKIALNLEILEDTKIERWMDVQSSNIDHYRTEIRQAIQESFRFKASLLANAAQWLMKSGRVNTEEFLEFQIQELPVLIDIYYNRGFLVDIYPGYYFKFFFELERGDWRNELPICYKATNGQQLCFITIPTNEGIQTL